MTSAIRASDTVGRIGGDEFVILMLDVGADENVLAVAEKIRQTLKKPYHLDGQDFSISTTIGIAIYPEHGSSVTELVGNADMAMYHAKEQGRDRVILFHASLTDATSANQRVA